MVINHEIMHYLDRNKGKKGFIPIKINLAKAYDEVEWRVLSHIMRHFEFCGKIIQLITNYIDLPHFSILLNGASYGYFKVGHGICQKET